MLIKWVRPSGKEIQTNDAAATLEKCEGLGWKRIEANKPVSDKPQRKKVSLNKTNDK